MSTPTEQQEARFGGLAFPIITVRLGDNKGTATMSSRAGGRLRVSESYDYSGPDGRRFAAVVARKLWTIYCDRITDALDLSAVLVPGNVVGGGYIFTAVPLHYFAPKGA